jgi:hypothetical protein
MFIGSSESSSSSLPADTPKLPSRLKSRSDPVWQNCFVGDVLVSKGKSTGRPADEGCTGNTNSVDLCLPFSHAEVYIWWAPPIVIPKLSLLFPNGVNGIKSNKNSRFWPDHRVSILTNECGSI